MVGVQAETLEHLKRDCVARSTGPISQVEESSEWWRLFVSQECSFHRCQRSLDDQLRLYRVRFIR